MNVDRATWQRLVAGPHAVSIWTFLAPLPLLVGIRFIDPVVHAAADKHVYLFATLVGQCAVGGGAWVAWRTLLRPGRTELRVGLTLAIFALLGVMRVATIAAVETAVGVPLSRGMPAELVVGAVQGLVVLATVSVVVNSRRDYVEADRRLREARDRIRVVEATDRATAERIGRQLLAGFVDEVADRLTTLAGDPRLATVDVSREVRALSSDFVRPMSHRVAQEWDRLMLSAVASTPRRPAESRWQRAASILREMAANLQPPHAWVVTTLMLALAAPALVRMLGGALTATTIAPSIIVLMIGTTLTARLMRHWHGRPLVLTCVLLSGSAVSAAATSILNSEILSRLAGVEHSFAEPIVMFTFFCVCDSLITTATHLAARHRAALLDSVGREATAGEELARNVSALRRAASQYLHSSVQAELTATALQLQHSEIRRDEIQSILRSAADRVTGGVTQMVGSNPADDLRAQLEFWTAAAGVTSQVETDTWQILAANPELSTRTSLVLSEALTNAVKHGVAGSIIVSMAPRTDGDGRALELQVRNSGELRRSTSAGGALGMSTMAALCDEFEVVADGAQVCVRGLICEG